AVPLTAPLCRHSGPAATDLVGLGPAGLVGPVGLADPADAAGTAPAASDFDRAGSGSDSGLDRAVLGRWSDPGHVECAGAGPCPEGCFCPGLFDPSAPGATCLWSDPFDRAGPSGLAYSVASLVAPGPTCLGQHHRIARRRACSGLMPRRCPPAVQPYQSIVCSSSERSSGLFPARRAFGLHQPKKP